MTCTPDCVRPTTTQFHCGSCHLTWAAVSGFDRHRRAGRCLTPDEIGHRPDSRGVYRAPITDAKRAQLAALGQRQDAPSASRREPQTAETVPVVGRVGVDGPDAVQTRAGGLR